jgi:hypothetical protein
MLLLMIWGTNGTLLMLVKRIICRKVGTMKSIRCMPNVYLQYCPADVDSGLSAAAIDLYV